MAALTRTILVLATCTVALRTPLARRRGPARAPLGALARPRAVAEFSPRARPAFSAVAAEGDSAPPAEDAPFTSTKLCKGLILFALVLQSGGASLLARRASMLHPYDGGVAGVLQEARSGVMAVKLPMALVWLAAARQPIKSQAATLRFAYLRPRELLALAVPAGCFAAQNVLFYFAHERLPATVYLTLSQSKTLFTALCSVALLPGKRLTARQWAAQPILMAGCALVLARSMAGGASSASSAAAAAGAGACLLSGLLSGFANVYFERILKSKRPTASGGDGYWPRQLQLSFATLLFTLPAAPPDLVAQARALVLWRRPPRNEPPSTPAEEIARRLLSFSTPQAPLVWGVIGLKAVGGLLIGATIKYASAITKNFASAVAIALTAALSQDARVSPAFRAGITLVVASMALYQSGAPKKKEG